MEFLPHNSFTAPKDLYPCLATITITPPTNDKSRRLSTTSSGNGGEEDNVLKRIASGGRRKSDASQRRKSFTAGGGGGGGIITGQDMIGRDSTPDRGVWYWRVQAGVTDNALILLPLTQPPNPVLTTCPIPLSEAMPSHAAHAHGDHSNDEGLVDKMKNLFRRGSKTETSAHPIPNASTDTPDKVIDQTAQGEQLPSAKGNAMGATNVNANAETGWPGVIDGKKLNAIAVPLSCVEKSKVNMSGGKKGEAYYITVPVTSYFAAMTAGFSEAGPGAKPGSIRLEFDKDWIGAKAESELLYHRLTQILSEVRTPAPPAQVQLGGGAGHNQFVSSTGGHGSYNQFVSSTGGHGSTTRQEDVAPDFIGNDFSGQGQGQGQGQNLGLGQPISAKVAGVESDSVGSGRKVAGDL